MPDTAPRTRRLSFRFGIRTLLLLFAAVALLLGWKASRIHQRQLVTAELAKLGGSCGITAVLPAWINSCSSTFYDECTSALFDLDDIEMVVFDRDNALADDQIEHIARLKYLKVVGIGYSRVTDKSLQCLVKLHKLEHLYAPGTAITDDGLRCLEPIPALEWIDLRGTQVTNSGVERLQQAHPSSLILYDR